MTGIPIVGQTSKRLVVRPAGNRVRLELGQLTQLVEVSVADAVKLLAALAVAIANAANAEGQALALTAQAVTRERSDGEQ